MLSYIKELKKLPMLVIAPDEKSAEKIQFDIDLFRQGHNTLLHKVKGNVKNHIKTEEETYSWLVSSLTNLLSNEDSVSIALPDVFNYKMPTSDKIVENYIEIKKGQKTSFDSFTTKLLLEGFEKVDYVKKEGQLAIRGGIVDILPTGVSNPIRIEFWGDEIDSIREFEINSQRSIKEYDRYEFLGKLFHEQNMENDADIYNFLPSKSLIVVLEPERLETPIEEKEGYKYIYINGLATSDITLESSPQRNYEGRMAALAKDLQSKAILGHKLFLSADGDIHINRFKEMVQEILFDETEVESTIDYASPDSTMSSITWLDSSPSEGFSSDELKMSVITEHQVFGRHRSISHTRKSDEKKSISLEELQALNIGDYVVHEDKGVCKFNGFQKVEIGDSIQDCVQLEFESGDKLFVNMNYIGKLQKYSAAEGVPPKLSKLGSAEWARRKARTKKKIKDIARNLIKLYAKRKSQQGFAFSEDNKWQHEFEASFIYEDTPDQAQATEEVKSDMESQTPMDRLICGDVGFGKTEVAIRAAFKAVQSGKQVAVLVPTTVLAQQHYMSFKDRLAKYPVEVGVMSRFRSKKQQTETLAKLERGSLDILIGTHRILSKDIIFKDLGLLIVDEEQRFGVAAKEKLRELRVSVDTLTLTATPIPRTLNFSLMGARDLSVIETPPRNRLPVDTEIAEIENELLTKAIERELGRGGQVFFVSDRVEDLDKIMLDLKIMVPSAKFAIAHGQMTGNQLENVMQDFISGRADVLVTTKIVESGIDIPNANTMIINRANNFGLAELYQLRGRVGRSNLQAYCYLLTEPKKKLSDTAMKRLQAIEEFTELGSGFKLALRDMEIRGAGNLLGGEQSGMIYDIGFDLYQKVLDEAVQELKYDEFSDVFEKQKISLADRIKNNELAIELDKEALIPDSYIPSDSERFAYYKKLYAAERKNILVSLEQEMIDKFGKIPEPVRNLMLALEIRIAAVKTGFERIVVKQDKMICEFPNKENEIYYEHALPIVLDFVQDIDEAEMKQGKQRLSVELPIDSYGHAVELLWKLKRSIELEEELEEV
ncbi:MAG: transcription-repair coupling factor [Candidatus Kapaibacteriales bacterium]